MKGRGLGLVAPVLLILVAGLQLFNAHVRHLTPWKGGGFGMFATVNERFLRYYLVSDSIEVRVEEQAIGNLDLPPLLSLRVRNMPSPALLGRIGERLLQENWVVYDLRATQRLSSDIPPPLNALLFDEAYLRRMEALSVSAQDSTLSTIPSTAPLLALRAAETTPDSLHHRFSAVRVEAWDVVFEAETNRLTGRKLADVTVSE